MEELPSEKDDYSERTAALTDSINNLFNGTVHKLVYRTLLPSLRSLEVRHPTCLSDSRVGL